ncbi:MAG: hypothetical protein L3K14_04160 [Thermoplasmata archaeon]|nr:hypothetical protein [Thermoplasmata archaeon]
MSLSRPGMVLVALAVAMFVTVFLLTPLSGFETRNLKLIHPIGVFTLVLVFVTAILNAVALAFLRGRPSVSAVLAGLGIFLVIPGFILDQTGQFATQSPPTAISNLEYVLVTLETALFLVAIWLYVQIRKPATDGPRAGGSSGPPAA